MPYFIILLLLLTGATRFWALGFISLDQDETATGAWVHASGLVDLYQNQIATRPEGNAFGYPALIYWWGFWAREPEWLRTLSALAGVATIMIFYFYYSRRLAKGPVLLASFLLSLSSAALLVSQNARVYALYGLAIFLSFLFFQQSVAEPQRKRWLVAYALAGAASLYFHHLAFLYLGSFWALGAWWVFKRRLPWRHLWAPVGALLLYLPHLPLLIYQMQHGPQWIPPISFWLLKFVMNYLTDMHHAYPTGLVWLLAAVGVLFAWRRRATPELVWCVFPLAAGILISLVHRDIFIPRYFYPSSIAIFVLVAHGLDWVWRVPRWGAAVAGASFLVALLFVGQALSGFYTRPRGEDFKAAADFVQRNRAQCSDLVLTDPVSRKRWPIYLKEPIKIELWGSGKRSGRYWILSVAYPLDPYIEFVAREKSVLLYSGRRALAACLEE